MATVRIPFNVKAAELAATGIPEWKNTAGTNFPVEGWALDGTASEQFFLKFRADDFGSGDLTLAIDWYADSGTTNAVTFGAQVGCITPDTDSGDIETKALDTATIVTDSHLGTTAQRLHRAIMTIANADTDSMTAGDYCILRIYRDPADAGDTMAGIDVIVTFVELTYSNT